jgi:hypothetical protein
MTQESDIRRRIKARAQATEKQRNLNRILGMHDWEDDGEFEEKRKRPRFIMPRFLLVLVIITLSIYAIVFAILALLNERTDVIPLALLFPTLGTVIVVIGMYIQYFLTWITYRYFWLFVILTWLFLATASLVRLVQIITS